MSVNYTWTLLPLYEEWDYVYSVVLEGTAYTLRIYYSDRTQQWSMDISYQDGKVIAEGDSLLPFKAGLVGQLDGLSGFFWLEPIAFNDNQTIINPENLWKYYRFYYIGDIEEVT